MPGPLTKGHDNGAGDAISHNDSEDTEHPRIHGSKLVFKGLVLGKERVKELTSWFCPQTSFCALQAWQVQGVQQGQGRLGSWECFRKAWLSLLQTAPDSLPKHG